MEQCETEGCSGVVFKQHLCLVCANKLFDIATSSEYQGVKIVEDHSLKEDEFKMVATSSDVMEIIKAVAHIGVDFGFGEYVLEDKHIEAARRIIEATLEKNDE